MHRLRIGIVAAFLLTAAAAGTAGHLAGPEPEPAPPAEPSAAPDLSATAEIRRSFMAPGTVTIAVVNRGDAPVEVVGIDLATDSFAPLGVQDADTIVPPGETPRDLLIDLGAPVCPGDLDPTAAPAVAHLRVATEDGAVHEVAAAIPHPSGTLDRLLREACTAEFLAANAAVELGELREAADGTLEGDLAVTPLAGADLAVTQVRGSVLFTVDAPEGLPAAGGDLAVPLAFDAYRCEGHAIGDAKQPFGFTVWIAVDGGEPLPAPILVPEDRREALWAMLDVRCGRG